MRELSKTAQRWAAQRRTAEAVLARPVTERGFGPRHPGDAILIDADGTCHGSLYLGAFDRQLAEEAVSLAPGHTARVCAVAVHDDAVREAGLTCGGQAEILLQPLPAVPPRWWELLAAGADAALITWLDEPRLHAVSTVVTPGPGPDEADLPPQATARARELLARHRAGREVQATDAGLVLIETCPAVPRLVIVGGGELAELLVAQAGLLGWQAEVTATARDAAELLAERPAAACLIMLSHEPEVDVPTLRTALTSGIPYVGALGSRHTQERRAAGLVEAGLDDEHLDRIHGPIGLDIGARTPAETAMAICAEVLTALGH
ncbi:MULTISPECIES: XdhC family protein [unclassified Streptomyces]|uniref:XdhC family protein n=1 Tax=unclassified Streptomyces TaxID=2593676 RepID=UPI00224C9CCE|nr:MULTISPECIES: XdhC/CoxI family protein [unclassified Streptomyces]MCX5051641.1 XdhC family protein [Streptomyces sp. NBC_00474]MCX5249532.1 XdhC family protein [Streptomyces sp. NBC_00201]